MDHELLAKAEYLLHHKNDRELVTLFLTLEHRVIADVLESLERGRRKSFLLLPPETQSDVAMHLSEPVREALLPRLPDDVIARFLHFSHEDDATDVLQSLPPDQRLRVLELMQPEKRRLIEKLLLFGPETAGGLMDLHFMTIDVGASLQEALASLHAHTNRPGQTPILVAVNDRGVLQGYLPHRSLLFTSGKRTVRDLLQAVPAVPQSLDRERVIESITRSKSNVVCVVDEHRRPIGIIQLSDLLSVASAEATEDVYRFAGVDAEEQPLDSPLSKVRHRYVWLLINLGTAFLAAFVVSLFEGTIARLSILAVFMPIVAGQGGNAATQALAVVVRGLAVGDIAWPQARSIILRESLAGMCNGIITGVVAAMVAVLFGGPPMLGLVLGAAMIANLFVAGFFGSLIPFVLRSLRIDPAVASSIFVTTATDIFGFLAFLGLGSMLL